MCIIKTLNILDILKHLILDIKLIFISDNL